MQGSGIASLGEVVQGVHTKVSLGNKKTFVVDLDIRVNGTERFSFVPAGTVTTAQATSVWNTPSFAGAYLPTLSEVSESGFDASWRVSGLGRTFPEITSSETFSLRDLSASIITVGLFDGVDQYTLTMRAVKYAILFIALTFMAFFFVEVLHALRVHPIQYTLIGAALALFYLLLLSLSEQIAFGKAYLVASTLTTLLITSYAHFVLHVRRYALLIGAILALLYGYLYLVLRSEDYALLSGTLLLFGILATTMYITRKVDWYGLDSKQR
jgi:inner membrane protein